MRTRSCLSLTIFSIATLAYVAGCGGPPGERPHPDGGNGSGDASVACDPQADTDEDCIPDGVEGCDEMPPRDTDGDGAPDYADTDADGDGIVDDIRGRRDLPGHPRDNDNDGTPDFQDPDSDNDGVPITMRIATATARSERARCSAPRRPSARRATPARCRSAAGSAPV